MDSSRVLLALEEKLKWEGRKERIQEKLRKIRAKKKDILRQLEEARSRIAQLSAHGPMSETERSGTDISVRVEGLR